MDKYFNTTTSKRNSCSSNGGNNNGKELLESSKYYIQLLNSTPDSTRFYLQRVGNYFDNFVRFIEGKNGYR